MPKVIKSTRIITKKDTTLSAQAAMQYAEICMRIAELEAAKSELASNVMRAMEESNNEKIVTSLGNITRCERTSYTYTKKIKELEIDLKAAKEKEVASGKAKAEVTEYIRFITKVPAMA